MTLPLSQPLDSATAVGQRSSTSAQTGQRLDLLNQNGHQWMPPDMQTHLAASDTSDNELLSIADAIKQSVSHAWSGFSEAFDDTVLHKKPSTALALAQYLHGSLGPLPVRQDDLHTIQANLQKQGYGKDLDINGVWGPDWNLAYNDWASNLRTRQLAGDRPGSTSVAHAAHHWYDALLPSHAVNAVAGFAHGLADSVNTLLGDVAGDIVDIPHLLTGHLDQSAASNATRAWFQNLGGGDLTAEDVAKQNELKRVTQDVLTTIALVPVAGEGSAAARVVSGAWEGGVNRELAQRTTGTIAKSFFGGRTSQMIAEDAARRGPFNSRVFQNIPLLRQTGPVLGRLADSDGLYYRARTLLATPYALPQVRVAGALGQRYMIGGAGLQIAAQGLQAVGQGNQLTQDTLNTNILDPVDQALGRVYGNPGSHLFTRTLDTLGYVLHGPLGATATSTAVGDKVQNLVDGMNDLIGNYGAEGSWQRAVAKAVGTSHVPISDLHDAFGSEDLFNRFMANKIADLAASHYAQRNAGLEGLTFGSPEYRDRVGQLADEVWASPYLHEQAVTELLANKQELENRIAADMLHNRLHPSDYHTGMVEDPTGDGDLTNYAKNGVAWMTAGSHVQNLLTSGDARYLFGGDGRAVIANAQDALDHGYGAETPVRLSTTTRRDYTRQVTDLLGTVRKQVNDARVFLARRVTAAETELGRATDDTARRVAQGKLGDAKKTQTALEDALDGGNLTAFTDLMSKFGNPRNWQRLAHDTRRLRTLVDQGTTDRLTLTHLLENGVNPDELYSNINGPARHDPTVGSGDWLREHLTHRDGSLGLARKDTKTAQQAAADLNKFRARLEAHPDQQAKIEEQLRNYGFREFGMTERTLGVKDAEGLLQLLDDHASRLASEVFPAWDTPEHVHAQLAELDAAGYKLVLGSHIGHLWDSTLPSMPDLRGAISRRRRIAGALGVDPTQVSSRAAGQDATIRVLRNIDQVFTDPRFRAPPRVTAETIMQLLRDEKIVTPELKLPEHTAVSLTRPFHKRGIQRLAESEGLTYDEARAEYERGMAAALQLRDLSRKKFLNALTTPKEGVGPAGPWQWAGMDKQSANLIRRAVLRGYAERPGYIQGLATLEDWARGGFSILDKAAVRFAGDNGLAELVQRTAELPNSLVNLRNRLRFTLSPFFDFRRVAKQNVKMGIDGVTPVLNPLAHMIDSNTYTKAHNLLNKLIGDPAYAGFDDADRYLHQQSVWGLYNSRHFEAYYAWEKHQAGWTDDEIRQGIRRVFEYGSTRTSGRSALERTVNTVFFPFSFEKTLLRNVGAYMIDHPQQSLLLTGAITAYDDANQNNQISQWVNDHLPVLHDMQKLNAFAHGISPGEFGGINAPLMNLFLPQKWDGGLTKDNLKRFLPIWGDFARVLHDSREQAVITKNVALNSLDYAMHLGAPRGLLDPYRPTVTPEAQRREAYGLRSKFITALAPVLDHNIHNPTSKVLWPAFPGLPQRIIGQPVSRTTIGYLVKVWYPAYDPTSGAKYAIEQQEALDSEIAKIAENTPARASEYRAFQKAADTIVGHLNRGDYDTPQAASLMMTLRHIAGTLAETDPKFLRLFTQHYSFAFGPETEVPR